MNVNDIVEIKVKHRIIAIGDGAVVLVPVSSAAQINMLQEEVERQNIVLAAEAPVLEVPAPDSLPSQEPAKKKKK